MWYNNHIMNPRTTPKDFFLHLGATAVLYAAAVALINLWFSVINYFRPDALAGYYYANSMAWPISMLVVLVPVLYLLEWLIIRDMKRMPEKADLWIRRWRIYLTLFLAAVLIGGDLIALINVYLNGEITSRFVYKILVILLAAGCIGKYYFFSLYTNFRRAGLVRRFNAWFGLAFVVTAIVLGFSAVGSPDTQRALRFDQQRVGDLSNIQWQIISHWQRTGKLPGDLAALNDSISGTIVPTDPKTEDSYEYSTTGATSFQLCAVFERPTQDLKGRGEFGRGNVGIAYPSMPYPYPDNQNQWDHQAGRTCFDRTIDPDRYPVQPKPLSPAVI